ncbi:MAG: beta-ketoacyl-[acyl-carrier-protein] synthase family protein [Elusimicrobiota bacterium]|jgi:3-oxoacyl-[acyl-carrier-protein] synthase II|nr:beta-ketoacyl-[acyl-carrier-protein] synthase family protein [Elusimicrobiota bacterium]
MGNENRVVITGLGAVSPFGLGRALLAKNMLEHKSSVKFNPTLAAIKDLTSHVSSTVEEIDFSFIPRRFRRSMSKMSLYAYAAVKEALESANIEKPDEKTALFLGSTISSMQTWVDFSQKYISGEFDTVKTSVVFQVMNNSPLANISQSFDLKGPGFGSSTACATSLTNIGLAYLGIKSGFISQAIAGGTDEYHPIMTVCFAIMNAAASRYNSQAELASRPFDINRDGIVCGEGCGIIILESLQSALKRNAKIYGEIIGFGTNTETASISHPSKECIANCMKLALENAKLTPSDIDFVNAHATSTIAGDIEEAQAVGELFGGQVLVNSLKGHIGHTMAASGSLELIACLDMLEREEFAPTLNLCEVDPKCSCINLFKENKKVKVNTFIKNSFALGGTNCCLIVRRY